MQSIEPMDLYNDPYYPEFEKINTMVDYIRKVQAGDTKSPLVGGKSLLASPWQEVKKY